MRAALLLALLLAGCGDSWDLDEPISLSVDSPEIPAADAHRFFGDGLAQIGGHAVAGARQVVHVKYTTSCYGCGPLTVEHVDYHGTTIWVLPRQMLEPVDGLEDAVKHGLFHVLGLELHLPSSTHAMMTPLYCDRTDHKNYQAADKTALCTLGRVRGGRCG